MNTKPWFPILYMFVITALLSSVVIGLSTCTKERVQANELLNFETAILKVFPDMYDPGNTSLELHKIFVEKVSPPADDTGGAYVLRENGNITAYALPIKGQGFWAPVKAVIGIKADMRSVAGLAIYDQRETPGLGAEITKPEFCDQFKTVRISTEGIAIFFKRPGEELGPHDVCAITGATQTSVRFAVIINDGIREWRKALVKSK